MKNNNLPINIERMIRLHGIKLDKNANLEKEVSGEIRKLSEEEYKISVNAKEHYYRQRFTMAHELGHFLLHKDQIGDGVNDSPSYRVVQIGDLKNDNIHQEQETEANVFAANLLMPKEALEHYLKEERKSLREMSSIFQVSVKALEIRIRNLGLQTN
jgi:Zn-dependent peptidase ImmA (M78 family)